MFRLENTDDFTLALEIQTCDTTTLNLSPHIQHPAQDPALLWNMKHVPARSIISVHTYKVPRSHKAKRKVLKQNQSNSSLPLSIHNILATLQWHLPQSCRERRRRRRHDPYLFSQLCPGVSAEQRYSSAPRFPVLPTPRCRGCL